MEKLLELLNKYQKEVKNSKSCEWEKSVFGPFRLFVRDLYDEYHIYSETADTYAISKKYGFIKWLVENDKIDLDKVKEIGIKHNGKMDVDGLYRYSIYERVLMLLAISDKPIEDLLLYLK